MKKVKERRHHEKHLGPCVCGCKDVVADYQDFGGREVAVVYCLSLKNCPYIIRTEKMETAIAMWNSVYRSDRRKKKT